MLKAKTAPPGKTKGRDVLPGNLTLSGAPFQFTYCDKPQKGNTLLSTRSFTADGHILKYGIIVNDSPPIHREVDCLIDTGAQTQNYISVHIAKWLTSQGTKVDRVSGDQCIKACSVHECTMVDSTVAFK